MSKYILFGNYNKNYKFILYAILFSLLNNFLTEINYYSAFKSLRLFPTDEQKKFSQHSYIHKMFSYFGIFILSIAFYFYEKKSEKPKEITIKTPKNSFSELIYDSNSNASQIYKTSLSIILFILSLLIILDHVIDKYNCTLSHLDFWMLELIIISILNVKLTKNQIYKHHIFVFYLNIFPILFKIVTIYLAYDDDTKKKDNKFEDEKNNLRYIYLVYWYAIPIGIFMYLIFITLRAYVYIKIKWFIDIKFISVNKLLIIYGFMGTLFYLIVCIISTLKECNEDSKKNIYDYICSIYKNEIKDNNIVVTKKYLESFSVYGDNAEDFWDVLVEIIVIIIGMITTFFYRYNFMMIIKNLTPAHIIFLSPIYFFIFKIVLVFGNLIIRIFDKGTLMNNYTVESIKEIFALDILGDVFSFIGFLIYLEIIELNFCNLNFNLRKNITQRGVDETISFIDNDNGDLNESLNEEIERNESEKENNNKSLNLVSIKK